MTGTGPLHLLKYHCMDQLKQNYKFDKAKTSFWSVNVISKIPVETFTELYLTKTHTFAWDVIYRPTHTETEEAQKE